MTHIRAVVLSVLLVCSLLGGSVALAAPAVADERFEIEHTLAQSPERGEVDVTTRVSIPTGTTSMEIEIPDGTDVYETDGFTQVDENRYEWTRSTQTPSLQYTYGVNVTVDRGQGERFLYADTGEWAIFRTPSASLRYSGVERDVVRSSTVEGSGAAGPHISYLGPHEEVTEEAADQRFRFIIPEEAEMRETPSDVVETFEYAAERLDIGPRDPDVFVVVAPTSVEWAATGVQRGDADMWVRDVEALDSAANTWVHEYVHTRQEYEWTDETEWTLEGMADYYAALLTYERGDIDFEAFEERLERGNDPDLDDVVLTQPATWEDNEGDYRKGALVYGYLDYQLRAEADASIDDVIAGFEDGELTHEAFLDAIEDVGGSDIRADAERYTETTATPELWSHEEHAEAFGGEAPEPTPTPTEASMSTPDDSETPTDVPATDDPTPTPEPAPTSTPTSDSTPADDDGTTTPTLGDGSGFGVAPAVVGLFVMVLFLRRR